ncbi:MAG: type II secretion system F family protein [Herpetosiphonaceae bacterium]|nr:type II secretion system F family protein [Herpetosiphonaceae bacterium]
MGAFFLILIVFMVVMLGGVVLLIQRGRRSTVDERLANFSGAVAQADGPDLGTRVDEAVMKTKRGAGIARELAKADIKLTAGEFYSAKVAAAAVGAAFGGWFATHLSGVHGPLMLLGGALLLGIAASFIPNIYVGVKAKRRVKSFNNQLADTTAMLGAAIRSGSSFLQSMDLISREANAPVASEFKRVVQEVGLGLTTEAALANLYRRVPSDDLDLMITAINIQHEVGGNLAQILESISFTIRERVRIKGEIQTLTAQGRISGYVITGLPVGLAIMLTLINPDYMHPIFTWGLPPQAWCCLPVTSGAMIIGGYFTIMKIVNIEI